MTIGERIKMLRRKNDLTQERLAEFLSVSPQAVSKWECGLACPDLGLILPLTRILHVTADELLGGTTEENDERRAKYDALCGEAWKHDNEEMYQLACKAVSEYPGEYKYLVWLAEMENNMKMYELSIHHSNMVIEECPDSELRNRAIWLNIVCYKTLKQYDEALKYAEMLPEKNLYTRNEALRMCLRDEKLLKHEQLMTYFALGSFLRSLSEMYQFATEKTTQAIAALDMEEAVLKTIFADENYQHIHLNLCFLYEKRAVLELSTGDADKAMEYLRIMISHAQKYTELCDGECHPYTCSIFNTICLKLNIDHPYRPYIFAGDARNTKSVMEQIKTALLTEAVYAPLREREDFRQLLETL